MRSLRSPRLRPPPRRASTRCRRRAGATPLRQGALPSPWARILAGRGYGSASGLARSDPDQTGDRDQDHDRDREQHEWIGPALLGPHRRGPLRGRHGRTRRWRGREQDRSRRRRDRRHRRRWRGGDRRGHRCRHRRRDGRGWWRRRGPDDDRPAHARAVDAADVIERPGVVERERLAVALAHRAGADTKAAEERAVLRAVEVLPGDRVAGGDRHRRRHELESLDVDVRRRRGVGAGSDEPEHRHEQHRARRGSRESHPHTIASVPVASPPFAALASESARLGVTLSAEQIGVCERFASELIERNTSLNLTAITEPSDIAHKHFLDSFTALAARRWTGRERVIDVGSGAGFPGLALRIASPAIRLTLVESVGKKARFLEEVSTLLGLSDVEVRNERAEALARDRRDRYDVATARAVGTLGQCVEYLLPFLRLGGDAIVWKGRVDAELPGAQSACAAIGGEIVSIVPTASLGVGEVLPGRHLVVVRKTRPTPVRYPRTSAESRRRPW